MKRGDGPMDDLVAFHHVALSVRDCDHSARWYATVLGMEEMFREDGETRRACVMRFASGGYSIGLVEHRPVGGTEFDPRCTGLDHLAFTVPSRADLDRWADQLARHHIEHSGVIEIPPGAIVNFNDPDGIGLALFWDDPEASQ